METHLNITRQELEALGLKLGIKPKVGVSGLELALEQIVLLDRKQQDYGPHNIGKFGLQGLLVRINDKFERLINLITKNLNPTNEPTEDSFVDMSNYSIIGRLLMRNKWTGGDYDYQGEK